MRLVSAIWSIAKKPRISKVSIYLNINLAFDKDDYVNKLNINHTI